MMFNSLRIRSTRQFYFQSLETDVITTQHQTGNPSSFPLWLSSTSPKPVKHYSSGWQTRKYAIVHSLVLKVEELGWKRPDSTTCCIGEMAGQLIASVSGFCTLIQIKFAS